MSCLVPGSCPHRAVCVGERYNLPMPMDRRKLEDAITASGGGGQPDDQVEGLLARLTALEETGKYRSLIKSIAAANNKSNFLASLFEANFAWQFEAAGMPLVYEVTQVAVQSSSIDFKLGAVAGDTVYFELRLLQQDQTTADGIASQLSNSACYAVRKDGEDERKEVLRLQRTILQKVQKHDGTPIKFLKTGAGMINIVVVAVSDIILGAVDPMDCLLAACGDPAVPMLCRRGVFGLFQQGSPDDREEMRAVALSFSHIRATLHGVLFAFRAEDSGVLDYGIEQVMVWNSNLIDQARARPLAAQISTALPPHTLR